MDETTSSGMREDFTSGEGLVATRRGSVSASVFSSGNVIAPDDRIGTIANHANVVYAEEQAGQFDDASVEEDGDPTLLPAGIPNKAPEDTKLPTVSRPRASVADGPSSVYPPLYGNPLALNVSIPGVARVPVPVPIAIAPRMAAAASLVAHPFPIPTTAAAVAPPPATTAPVTATTKPTPARIESSDNDKTMAGKRVYADDICSSDVLCGRSRVANIHPGNVFFRRLLKIKLKNCVGASEYEKSKVAIEVVDIIRGLAPSGRFLKKHPRVKGIWIEIGQQRAREKTAQALHDGSILGKRSNAQLHKKGSALRMISLENAAEQARRKKKRVSPKFAKAKSPNPNIPKSTYGPTVTDSSELPSDVHDGTASATAIGRSSPSSIGLRMVPPMATTSDLLHNNPAYTTSGIPLVSGRGHSLGSIRPHELPTAAFATAGDLMYPVVPGARIPYLLGGAEAYPHYPDVPSAALAASSDLAYPGAAAAAAAATAAASDPYLSGRTMASLSHEIAASRLLLHQHPAYARVPAEYRLLSDDAGLLLGVPPLTQQIPGAASADPYLTELALARARLRRANGML